VKSIDLLITEAKQLIYFSKTDATNGNSTWRLKAITDGYVAIEDGHVVHIGTEDEVLPQVQIDSGTVTIDAIDKVVTPGLVDSHTHPVFHQTREHEFEMRVQGKSYEEIAAAGGGIRSSVRGVREASKEELKSVVRKRLDRFLSVGTTTIEAKSGYGLSLEDEVKSLEVIRELNDEHSLEMIPTFLGAHEVPTEYREKRDEYIQLVIKEMIPYVAENGLAEFCDIFCEQGVYTVSEARQILSAAGEAGLRIKLHADQLHLTGATRLAIELQAVSADHLECLGDEGIQAMASSKTIAGLLPGAVFFLGSHRYPPARKLLDAGTRVCLATDFNPGSSMTQSLPLMMTLGCLFMKMTPEEALMASTIFGAASICREEVIGNLLPGYRADVVLWDADDYRQIPYYYGVNLVNTVIKKGKVVFKIDNEQN
jgi:imidazolonepropionase